MSLLSNAKALGGVGAILILLFPVPTVGVVLAVAGFVMILFAVKYLSEALQDERIFKDMLNAVLFAIVGIAVAAIVVVATLLSAFQNDYFIGNNPMTPATLTPAKWMVFGIEIFGGLLALWILFLVSAVYLRRSYYRIGSELDVGVFRTAGLIYFIGAATAVIAVGLVIILVAEILTAVAFFSIPEHLPEKRPAAAVHLPPS